MDTFCKLMRPDGTEETQHLRNWPSEPGYETLNALIAPLLGVGSGEFEHVSVLHDGKAADMFVDETGLLKCLPRNETATAIYRAATLRREPKRNPESLPFIVGPALIFNRRVWF